MPAASRREWVIGLAVTLGVAAVVAIAFTVWLVLALQEEEEADRVAAEASEVTAAEFGSRWPLVPQSGSLSCRVEGARRFIYLVPAGETGSYGLNGQGRSDPLARDIVEIMRPGALPYELQPLIDRGLQLCDEDT